MAEPSTFSEGDSPEKHVFTKVHGVFAVEKRIMLIGPSNSGKTTFLTQLEGLSTPNFTDTDYDNFRLVIQDNVVSFLQQTMDSLERKNTELSPAFRKYIDPYLNIRTSGIELSESDVNRLKNIYLQPVIQKEMSALYVHQYPHAQYIIRNLQTLLNKDFQPTMNSLTRARVRTVGINRKAFVHKDDLIQILDCGGARSERSKIKSTTNISKIIFFISLSDYDLPLYEANDVNRLDDALDFYHQVCDDKDFERCPITLVFTHYDMLCEKLKTDLDSFLQRFPDFKGNVYDPAECAEYIASLVASSTTRNVEYHITNLINISQTQDLILKLIPFH